MIDRIPLKMNAKAAMQRNYWMTVLWALVLAGISAFSGGLSLEIIGLALWIMVGCPFRLGYARWLLRNRQGYAPNSDIGYFFKGEQMGRTITGLLVTDLITWAWSLLFVVPGIIARYRYYLVPYLMAENEYMTGAEAREISTAMMDGYKMDAFVLELSFIGWELLNGLTLGILGVFWVNPYINGAKCEFYVAVRMNTNISVPDYSYRQNNSYQVPYGQNDGGYQVPYGQNNGSYQAPYGQNNGGYQAPYGQNPNAAPGAAAQQQPNVRYCPNCGAQITGAAGFCSNCGVKL